jgi:hypothetical protein
MYNKQSYRDNNVNKEEVNIFRVTRTYTDVQRSGKLHAVRVQVYFININKYKCARLYYVVGEKSKNERTARTFVTSRRYTVINYCTRFRCDLFLLKQ